jgi:tRNA-splicing ligase RtcB
MNWEWNSMAENSKIELKKINDYTWEIPKTGKMNVPGIIFASEKLIEDIKQDDTFNQIINVASLPGLVDKVILCPDAHMGYGMPIGGVAAFDIEKGVIAPGMIGFDINCGIRLVATDITKKEFMSKRESILHEIKRTIPSGVGRGGKAYSRDEILEVLKEGAEWAVRHKMGTKKDLEHTEENGKMEGANPEDVSQRAIARGLPQLGTLGAGNHFIDIVEIEEIYDDLNAKQFNLKKGNIGFILHCGSRGLGHQVASDYLQLMEKEFGSKIGELADRELVYLPINSELGKKYFSAMKCAVNFAFCNRQMIMYQVKRILEENFPGKKINLVYDIAHNIAKIEKHLVGGRSKNLLIVRKGATRSFDKTPVIIPGSMSTPSFLLIGTKESERLSFSSSAHGAGRAHSRTWAHKELSIQQVRNILKNKDIILEGGSKGTIEESELSYKNVEEVIAVTEKAKLSRKIAKLKPLAVMIG